MTTAERQTLRIAILQMLRAQGGDAGMAAPRILDVLRTASYQLTEPALESELQQMADSRLVKCHETLAGKRWRITASAQSDLEEAGL